MNILYMLLFGAFLKFNSIKVEGAHFFAAREVKKVLSIKRGTPYNLLFLRSRENRVIELYKGYGFFDARVIEREVNFKKNTVDVLLEIQEGKRYKIKKIDVIPEIVKEETGVLKYKHYQSIPFSYEILGEIEDFVIKRYANDGYPFVTVQDTILTDIENKEVGIIVKVEKGKKYRVDSVVVVGDNVRKKLVKKVIVIRAGEYFSRDRLLKSLREINALGIFNSTTYNLKATSDSTISIFISIKMSKPIFVRVSAGYSQPEEFNGILRIGHDNVFKNAQKVTLQYEFLRSLSYPLRRKVEFYYTDPVFFGKKFSMQLHPFYIRDYDMNNEVYGIDFSLGKRIGDYSALRLFTGLKNASMGKEEHGFSNSMILTYGSNRTNNFFYPTRGVKYNLKLQNTGGILGGNFDFRRFYFSFAYYHSIEGYVFAGQCVLMYQKPFGRTIYIPFNEKFRIGGDGSLRGVGRDFVLTDAGGLFNVEIRRKFTQWLGASVFVDNFYLLSGIYNFIQTPGFGVRIHTPVGPIRFDIASPVTDLKDLHLNIAIGEMF